MKSFRSFIIEIWLGQKRKEWNDGTMVHKAKVHGHDVHIAFFNDKTMHKQHQPYYEINYAVNDKIVGHGRDRTGIPHEHGMAILHHVHKTIDRFVRHRKPGSISMESVGEPHKDKLYMKLAHHIAKKHNGVIPQGMGAHVEFPHNIAKKK